MYTTMFADHATLLKALAHPKRLEILHLLREQSLCVSEIQTMLGLPQANISQHLQQLRSVGVVRSLRNGKQLEYSLAHENFILASDLLREVLIDRASDRGAADELTLSMKEMLPLVHDPVCQMRLSPKTAAFMHEYKNTQYYFCASGCVESFMEDPTKYAK
jgi:DNA-binding transcriptional ArsR family regulator/YHS domain-containing protein